MEIAALNLPFSKLAIVVGDPIAVPDGAGPIELEATRLAVEHGLNDVTQRAYDLAGGKDPLAVFTGKVDDRLEW